jgi:hypothetical protein
MTLNIMLYKALDNYYRALYAVINQIHTLHHHAQSTFIVKTFQQQIIYTIFSIFVILYITIIYNFVKKTGTILHTNFFFMMQALF